MQELWDCYDRDFKKVKGKVLVRDKASTFTQDEYHLVCDIAVKHEDGTFLLMQRDFNKKVFPGYWEFSAGGSALKGETPEQCAKRELLEETGLVANQLLEIGRMTILENHSHYVIFMATVSGDKNAVVLQKGETINYKWVTKEELLKEKSTLATYRIFTLFPDLNVEQMEMLAMLTSKDDKKACEITNQIIEESKHSNCWYMYFHQFAMLLDHPKSLVRNRAIYIIAANIKWDEESLFENIIEKYLSHITDDKPMTARQCIKAACQIGLEKPKYRTDILEALKKADLSKYKENMRPLIKKDISQAIALFNACMK